MAWPNLGLAHRPVAMGRRGMVASASAVSSLAGLRILQQGGNAVDAAVATAAALSAGEPHMSGIAGVGYMVIHTVKDGRTRVLDYTGRAAFAATPEAFASDYEKDRGVKSPMTPGACAGWFTALETCGTMAPADVFAPAIEHFEGGTPVTLHHETIWQMAQGYIALNQPTIDTFYPGGRVPKPGALVRQPNLARTLRELIADGWQSFYRGDIARRAAAALQAEGGLLTEADFAAYAPVWRDPISIDYRDAYTIACPPPPCAGIQYLEAFRLLENDDLAAMGQASPATIHLMAEAFKIANTDRVAWAAREDIPTAALLSRAYARARRAEIAPDRVLQGYGDRFTSTPPAGAVAAGEASMLARVMKEATSHFSVVDAEGNAVSATQSLGAPFGSGVTAGDTGLVFNNFHAWFDRDPASPNAVAPNKTIEMCLSPAMLFRDGRFFMAIGTPGSTGIMQTTPQFISNVIDHGFSIQAAIEAPRFRVYEGTTLEMEARFAKDTRDQLERLGHHIRLVDDRSLLMGGAQGIMVDPETGVYLGGADFRRDGAAVGW